MNINNPLQFLQQGFYVSLGATAALVESCQSSQKRQENLAQLRLDPTRLTQLWADKGQLTEAEARALIERLLERITANLNNSFSRSSQQSGAIPHSQFNTSRDISNTSSSGLAQTQLEQLIADLAHVRQTLEQERQSSG